jgi:SAM-dependent methyltransferase
MKPTTTDEVLDLVDAHFTAAALGTAMELGLFWLLEDDPRDAAGVARELGIPTGRCSYWLQLLSSAGLVEESSGRYAPSATARTAILAAFSRDTWALLAEEAKTRSSCLRDLTLHIGESASVWEILGMAAPMHTAEMARNPRLARRFTHMLHELHQGLAEDVAGFLDLRDVSRLMDLGGGSGVMSMALLRRYPRLHAAVVDIENVCAVGRAIAAARGLKGRIDYLPADFLHDELPSGFDMVLECDVDIYGPALFSKVRDVLKPGGRFVIVDQLAPEEHVAPPSRVHWAFLGSLEDPGFRFLTPGELRDQLKGAGFRVESERALPPVPGAAARFTQRHVVIEARK